MKLTTYRIKLSPINIQRSMEDNVSIHYGGVCLFVVLMYLINVALPARNAQTQCMCHICSGIIFLSANIIIVHHYLKSGETPFTISVNKISDNTK